MNWHRIAQIFPLLFAVLLAACSLNQKQATNPSHQAVNRIFQNAVKDGFSGTALVSHQGTVLLHEAAGFANEALAIPNTINTVFDIASVTKQYTAALIIALQEAGTLSK